MLDDRPYMRQTTSEQPLSFTVLLLIVNAVVFVIQSLFLWLSSPICRPTAFSH